MVKAATLEVEIGAKIDKFERSLGKVRKDLKGMETRLGGVSRGASKATTAFSGMAKKLIAVGIAYFGARGIFRMAKSFLDVATSVETYKLRLEAMLGSQEAATDAMAYFQEVAAKVPFTLEEVIEAGVKVQAFGADLKAWTPIMADLAAFMGVTLPEAAGALGRAFAGGVGAADIFRERGILQVIKDFAKMERGIDDLTKISLPEFRDVMFEAFAGAESKVAGTADKLATTWVGVVSMLQDKWFQFKDTVMKAEIFGLMKEELTSFNESMDKFVESGQLEVWAKNMAIGVIGSFKLLARGVETLLLVFQGLNTSIFAMGEQMVMYMQKVMQILQMVAGTQRLLTFGFRLIKEENFGKLIEDLKTVSAGYHDEVERGKNKIIDLVLTFDKLTERLNAVKDAIKDTKDETGGLIEKIEEFGTKIEESTLPPMRNFKDLTKGIIDEFKEFRIWSEISAEGLMLFHVAIDAFAGGVMNALDAFHRFGEEGGNIMETLGGVIHGFVAEAINALKKFTMQLLVESAKTVFAKQAEAIAGVIASVMKSVPFPLNLILVGGAIATVSALFSGLKPKSFATGGYVPEETFAHLHPGERVLSAAEVRGQSTSLGLSPAFSPVINLTINARTLDWDTVNRASEMIYDAMERQGRRRG